MYVCMYVCMIAKMSMLGQPTCKISKEKDEYWEVNFVSVKGKVATLVGEWNDSNFFSIIGKTWSCQIVAFYTCSFDTGIHLILSLCKFLKLNYITWGLNYFTNKVEVFVDLYIQFTQVWTHDYASRFLWGEAVRFELELIGLEYDVLVKSKHKTNTVEEEDIMSDSVRRV